MTLTDEPASAPPTTRKRKPRCGACEGVVEDGEWAKILPGLCRACEVEAIARGLDGATDMRRAFALPKRRNRDGTAETHEQAAPWVASPADERTASWNLRAAAFLRGQVTPLRRVQAARWLAASDREWRWRRREVEERRIGEVWDAAAKRETQLEEHKAETEKLEADLESASAHLEGLTDDARRDAETQLARDAVAIKRRRLHEEAETFEIATRREEADRREVAMKAEAARDEAERREAEESGS